MGLYIYSKFLAFMGIPVLVTGLIGLVCIRQSVDDPKDVKSEKDVEKNAATIQQTESSPRKKQQSSMYESGFYSSAFGGGASHFSIPNHNTEDKSESELRTRDNRSRSRVSSFFGPPKYTQHGSKVEKLSGK